MIRTAVAFHNDHPSGVGHLGDDFGTPKNKSDKKRRIK